MNDELVTPPSTADDLDTLRAAVEALRDDPDRFRLRQRAGEALDRLAFRLDDLCDTATRHARRIDQLEDRLRQWDATD